MGISAMVDSAPVRTHVQRLMDAGMLAEHIATAAGLGPATVSEIRRGQRDKMKWETAKALFTVQPQAGWTVPALGTIRRARALVALGWTFYEIEQRAGLSRGYLRLVCHSRGEQGRVLATSAMAVADTYEDMSMTPGPSGRQRSFARNRGWAPPLAWNNIDDPDERPKGCAQPVRTSRFNPSTDAVDPVVVQRILAGDWRLACSPAEKASVIEQWAGPLNELERLTGWNVRRYKNGDAA
jgi:hypothetical protein